MADGTWNPAIPAWLPGGAASAEQVNPALHRERVWELLARDGLVWRPDGESAERNGALTLSWPEEWTWVQWRDAALHVLDAEEALRIHGWTLCKVNAQWVQFSGCRPVWISQTALAPFDGRRWPGRQEFLRQFAQPMLDTCIAAGSVNRGSRWQAWRARWKFLGALRGHVSPATGADLAGLRSLVRALARCRDWTPCRMHESPPVSAGLAGVIAREQAVLRGAKLVYEWRGALPQSGKLAPAPGAAWVRLHASAQQAAADYLDESSARGAALPLVRPAAGGPWRRAALPADLGIAAGPGNVPVSLPSLQAFAAECRQLCRAALVEFLPQSGYSWEAFLAAFDGLFRPVRVFETGPGRRLCLFERA
jgi:hypothetical protein